MFSFLSTLILSSASAAPAPTPAPTTTPTHVYTVETALQAVLERRPEVLEKRERVREGEAGIWKAWGSVAPNVTGNLNAYGKRDAPGNPNALFSGDYYNLYQASLELKQPIFSGGALWGEVQRQRAELNGKRVDLAIEERKASERLLKSFYKMLLAETQHKTLLKQEEVRENSLKIAQSRYRVGNEKELAVLRTRTQLALLKPQILSAKNDLTVAAMDFALLVGELDRASFRILGSLDAPEWAPLAARMRERYSVRKLEVERKELDVEALRSQRLVTMSTHWPSLGLVGTLERDAYRKSDLMDPDFSYWSVGLKLSIPLFSGLTSFAERRVLAAQEAALRVQEKGLRDDAANALASAQMNLNEAIDSVAATKEALPLAERAAELARRNYRLGIATYIELSDAETNYVDAQLTLDKARHRVLEMMVEYFNAAGWPLQELSAALPKTRRAGG